MAQDRVLLNDEQWEKIAPLLPKVAVNPSGGRPRAADRACLEGILWILWTGAPWRALPQKYPSASTCWRRLSGWEDDGTWERIWETFIAELDEGAVLDWRECFIDATFIPAKKGAPKSAKPSGARAQNLWWWRTARGFLWATSWPLHRPRKSRSPKKRSTP